MTVIGDAAWRKRERARKLKEGIWQAGLLFTVALLIGYFVLNVSTNLQVRSIHSGFDFLLERAGIEIGETLIDFSSTDTFFKAFVVGLLNTIKVSVISIISATVIGVLIGLMRLSSHPLLRMLGTAHVEFYRNIPLLVQLLLIYMLITELLPMSTEALQFGQWALLSKAGLQVSIPIHNGVAILSGLAVFVVSFLLFKVRFQKKYTDLVSNILSGIISFLFGFFTWILFGIFSGWSHPEIQGFAIEGGTSLSPEFLSLWIGLTLFTSASIAEIVRAGVLAVPQRQWSASYALGMSSLETISYVIFPQALRLAIPPLSSQYMNLTKNSSLAVIVGYPDLVSIGNSTINLNGQALEVIVITMVVYLFLNLVISVLMNLLNARVTRGTRQ